MSLIPLVKNIKVETSDVSHFRSHSAKSFFLKSIFADRRVHKISTFHTDFGNVMLTFFFPCVECTIRKCTALNRRIFRLLFEHNGSCCWWFFIIFIVIFFFFFLELWENLLTRQHLVSPWKNILRVCMYSRSCTISPNPYHVGLCMFPRFVVTILGSLLSELAKLARIFRD